MHATMTAPKTTHLQFFVMLQISRGKRRGKDLRAAIRGEKISQSQPTFHAFMRRLERDGLVAGKYVPPEDEIQRVERWYTLTAAGRKALAEVRAFYRRIDGQQG